MRGSALALAAAVLAASVYVATAPEDRFAESESLVPEAYVYEAQRQVDIFLAWLRDDDATPQETPA